MAWANQPPEQANPVSYGCKAGGDGVEIYCVPVRAGYRRLSGRDSRSRTAAWADARDSAASHLPACFRQPGRAPSCPRPLPRTR